MKRRWTFALLALLLFLSLPVPVWADEGDDQVVFFGDRIVLGPGDAVDGNLVVFGGSVEMREGSRVDGDLVAVGGESVVDGRIAGSLVVVGGTLDLRDNATVLQELITFGADVSQAEGARVFGERIEGFRWKVPPLTTRDWSWPSWTPIRRTRTPQSLFSDLFGSAVRWVLRTFALMALGVVVMLLLPKQTELVGQTVSQLPLPSTGVGLLTFVVLLFLVPLLVIICIGIPVVAVLAGAFVAALLLGRVAVGALVGERLLAAINVKPSQPLLHVVVGIGLIELLSAVPCLGWLLGWVLALAGLGAVVLTRFGTMIYEPQSGRSELPAPTEESSLDVVVDDEAEE
jgi:hypothetical protein